MVQKNQNNSKTIGIIIGIIHFSIFIYFYLAASSHHAQWQLSWIPLSIIDFPVSVFLLPLSSITSNLNLSAFFIHGILGTLWWYWISSRILNKILS